VTPQLIDSLNFERAAPTRREIARRPGPTRRVATGVSRSSAARPAAAYAPFSWRPRQAGFEVAPKELCEVVVIASSQANTPREH